LEENEDLDLWLLVAYMDPLYTQHYSAKTIYYSASILGAILLQLNNDSQNANNAQNDETYKQLLIRLAARVNYRLKDFSASLGKEDETMALGALRLLDAHINTGLKNFGITNGYSNRWPSIKADLERFKNQNPGESSAEFQSLLIAVDFATVYALITGQPDKLKDIVNLFETKPSSTLLSGGYRATDYKKHYTDVIVQMYNTLFNSVKEGLVSPQTIKEIPQLLVDLGHPSHGTDTRVHAVLTAGLFHGGLYTQKKILSLNDNTRQKMTRYAGDILRQINGCLDTLGLSSQEIKVLSDHLAQAVQNLLPIWAPKAEWDYRYHKFHCTDQKIRLTIIYDQILIDERTTRDKVCIYTSDGYVTQFSLDNDLNTCAVNREYRDMGARLLFDWVLIDIAFMGVAKLFTTTAGAARFLPASIRAASIAPTGSKITRFAAKLRQGTKYGTKFGFASKISEQGFIITNTKTVTATVNKTAATGAKTATKTGSKTAIVPVQEATSSATTQSLKEYEFTHVSKSGAVSGTVTAPNNPLGRAEALHAMQQTVKTAPVTTEEILQYGITNLPGALQNPAAVDFKATITPEMVQQGRLTGGLSAKEIQSQYQFQQALKSVVEDNSSILLDENAISGQLLTNELRQRTKMAIDPNFNLAGQSPNAPWKTALESENLRYANMYDGLNQMGFQSAYLSNHPIITRFENTLKWAGDFMLADMVAYGPAQQYTEYRVNADRQKEIDKAGVKLDGNQAADVPSDVTPQDIHSAITSAQPQSVEGSSFMIPIIAIMSSHNKLVTDNQRALFRQLATQQKNASLTQTFVGVQMLKGAQNSISNTEFIFTQGLKGETLSAEQKNIQHEVVQWTAKKKEELEEIAINSKENVETRIQQISHWNTEFLAQEKDFALRFIENPGEALPRAAQERIAQTRAGIKRILNNSNFSEEQKTKNITNLYEQCIKDLNMIYQQYQPPVVSSDAAEEFFSDKYNSDAPSLAY